jgi:hypothetical protein
MAWKTFAEKNYKNNLRSNNYGVCTVVARCFPNIFDVIVLENLTFSSDKNRATAVVVYFSVISRLYIRCQQCIFQPHVNFICTCTLDLEVFNFSAKITWFAIYLMLWTEFITCQSTNLKRRWLEFCNYYPIQCVCNHSTALVVIFSFWHIQNFIVNLDILIVCCGSAVCKYLQKLCHLNSRILFYAHEIEDRGEGVYTVFVLFVTLSSANNFLCWQIWCRVRMRYRYR